LEARAADCTRWLEEIREKLACCSDLSASSQKDLEKKLETIQVCCIFCISTTLRTDQPTRKECEIINRYWHIY